MREFQSLLQDFLIDYLPKRRGFSPHTIAAYRDSFVLLLTWMDTCCHVTADKIIMADLDVDHIRRFTDWLQHERGCAESTSNARIAAIRSFAKFVQSEAPEHIEICRRLLTTPIVKVPEPAEIEYLSVEGVQFIVAAAAEDIRDLAIVSLLYDSGARVSEVRGVTIGDLVYSRPHTVRVMGKGRKARVIPLSTEVGDILGRYVTAERAQAESTEALFINRSHNRLGRAGIAYVLQKSVTAAHRAHPTAVPPRVHPHIMRHSKAMHLLDAGVNLVYIRDFLGHRSVTTTEIYARASTAAKRRAIEAGEANIVPTSPYGKEQRADLVDWLRDLL